MDVSYHRPRRTFHNDLAINSSERHTIINFYVSISINLEVCQEKNGETEGGISKSTIMGG